MFEVKKRPAVVKRSYLEMRIAIFFCALLWLPSVVHADVAITGYKLDLDRAVEIAISENPSLFEMQSRYEALKYIPSQVGSLPDPMLMFGGMNFPVDTFDRDQEAMTQVQVGFSQAFPFPGKLDLMEEAAEFDAIAAGYSVEEGRLKIADNVKYQWWQIYFLDRSLEVIKKNRELLRDFIDVAIAKYKTGKGLQQDVLLAQLELSKLIEQDVRVKAMRQRECIKLNILMNRPAETEVVLPREISKSMPSLLVDNRLYEVAENNRPLLKQFESNIDAARARLDLANKEYYPDITVAVTYGDRIGSNPMPMGGDREDMLSVMVGLKVPLYFGSKQSKSISQKSKELQRHRYSLVDIKSHVFGEITLQRVEYQRSSEQIDLFATGIIPLAKQSVDSMLVGYKVGDVDFLNLIKSQVTLFNYELQYWKSLSEAKQSLAHIEAAVGGEFIYE